MKIVQKTSFRSEARNVTHSDDMIRLVMDMTLREYYRLTVAIKAIRIEALLTSEDDLTTMLLTYSGHTDFCAKFHDMGKDCTCGLATLQRSLSDVRQELRQR